MAVPRVQATAAIDILIELYFVHSLKSLSIAPCSGAFALGWEAALAVSMSWLLMGLTVWRFMSLVSSDAWDPTTLTYNERVRQGYKRDESCGLQDGSQVGAQGGSYKVGDTAQ